MDLDDESDIYIADRENRRIQMFNRKGEVLGVWNGFSRVEAICVSGEYAYVGEYYAGGGDSGSYREATDLGPRITKCDLSGNIIARIGREPFGAALGRFYAPHGIAADSNGDV